MLKIKFFVFLCFALSALLRPVAAQVRVDEVVGQSSAKLNRSRGLNMLDEIKNLIEQRYYDKNFRGVNLDERFKVARERVKTLDTNWQIFRAIAQVILEFDDSHTRFYPPTRSNRVEYGFSMQMIGDRCFIVDVKKGSDAEAKGVKVGDQIVGIGNFNPTRENLWKMNYLLYSLDPQESIRLYTLKPDKTEKETVVLAKFNTLEDRKKKPPTAVKKKRKILINARKLTLNSSPANFTHFRSIKSTLIK